MILPTVAWSPPGYVSPAPGHASLGVVEVFDPDLLATAFVSAVWNDVCDCCVLSSNDIRAEFSMVGSRLNHGTKARLSSPVPADEVVEEVVVDPVVVEHEKLESAQPSVNGGLP